MGNPCRADAGGPRSSDALLRRAIEQHGGEVFKTIGDAFCAAFDDPREAVNAAVAAQRALQKELAPRPLLVLPGDATRLEFSPDGQRLARSGEITGTVRIWDLRRSKDVLVLDAHKNLVRAMAFSPQGDRLATGSTDGVVRIWDLHSGEAVLTARAAGAAADIKFSPDGKTLAVRAEKGIHLWRADVHTSSPGASQPPTTPVSDKDHPSRAKHPKTSKVTAPA